MRGLKESNKSLTVATKLVLKPIKKSNFQAIKSKNKKLLILEMIIDWGLLALRN